MSGGDKKKADDKKQKAKAAKKEMPKEQKKEEKKEEPAAAAEAPAEKKSKDPFLQFPASETFIIDEWKKVYSNEDTATVRRPLPPPRIYHITHRTHEP